MTSMYSVYPGSCRVQDVRWGKKFLLVYTQQLQVLRLRVGLQVPGSVKYRIESESGETREPFRRRSRGAIAIQIPKGA